MLRRLSRSSHSVANLVTTPHANQLLPLSSTALLSSTRQFSCNNKNNSGTTETKLCTNDSQGHSHELLKLQFQDSLSPVGLRIHDIPSASVIASNPSRNDISGKYVTLRGRVQTCRVKGKIGFVLLRQPPFQETIQIVLRNAPSSSETSEDSTHKDMQSLLSIGQTLTPESIIEVAGQLVPTDRPIHSATCDNFELHATKIHIITLAETPLPFPLHDKNVKLDTRLDHRVIDLRTQATSAILHLVSIVNRVFRDVLAAQQFVEIHTPKLLGTPSEGGSSVFTLSYFNSNAFLAQSPQLYKQMVLMGDAMRVFEVGPVFRAEKSLTHRHLTEFVGLDAEMVVHTSYTEVLDVLEATLVSMVDALEQSTELVERVHSTRLQMDPEYKRPEPIVARVPADMMAKYSFAEDQVTSPIHSTPTTNKTTGHADAYGARVSSRHSPFPVLRLTFDSAMQMLVDAKHIAAPLDDFSTVMERQLGQLVKERYGVDVYIVDQFPVSARPFYTGLILPPSSSVSTHSETDAPSPWNVTPHTKTRSYDMYLRGEEICSGAQRIHDPKLLEYRMKQCGVDVALIRDYVNSFRYGAWPHGGFGLGLERIVMFFLGAADIRQVSLFPRDPKRITP